MKTWSIRFWDKHGERLVFAFIATCFALSFWYAFDWKEAAKTILIGVAMLMYNKTRSGDKDDQVPK